MKDSLAQKPNRLFSKTYEQINLTLPFVFLAVVAVDIVAHLPAEPRTLQLGRFLTSSLLLNNLHVYMTFAFLLMVPEFSLWRTQNRQRGKWRTIGISVLVFLCAPAAIIALNMFKVPQAIQLALLSALIFPNIFHALQQVKGLSLLYNRIAQDGIADFQTKEKIKLSELRERRLFSIFAFTYFLYIIAGEITPANQSISVLWRDVLLKTSMYAFIASVFAILVNGLTVIRTCGINKFIFNLRILLFAAVPFSNWAGIGLASIHGIEYAGVYQLVARKSQIGNSARRRLYWLTLGMMGAGLLMLMARPRDGIYFLFSNSYENVPQWIKVVGLVSLGLTYVHYYVDGVIFRMSTPEVRKNILPLLVPTQGAVPLVGRLLDQERSDGESHIFLGELKAQGQRDGIVTK